jgi:hypothetical protein
MKLYSTELLRRRSTYPILIEDSTQIEPRNHPTLHFPGYEYVAAIRASGHKCAAGTCYLEAVPQRLGINNNLHPVPMPSYLSLTIPPPHISNSTNITLNSTNLPNARPPTENGRHPLALHRRRTSSPVRALLGAHWELHRSSL